MWKQNTVLSESQNPQPWEVWRHLNEETLRRSICTGMWKQYTVLSESQKPETWLFWIHPWTHTCEVWRLLNEETLRRSISTGMDAGSRITSTWWSPWEGTVPHFFLQKKEWPLLQNPLESKWNGVRVQYPAPPKLTLTPLLCSSPGMEYSRLCCCIPVSPTVWIFTLEVVVSSRVSLALFDTCTGSSHTAWKYWTGDVECGFVLSVYATGEAGTRFPGAENVVSETAILRQWNSKVCQGEYVL